MREVCGDAVTYFDPEDHRALARELRSLARAADDRTRLKDRGLLRAQAFSWRASAERNLTAVQEVCAAE